MFEYKPSLKEIPAYDVTERDWRIKVNANESNLNLPPMVEDRLMGRLASVAFNRYPNEESDLLAEQIAEHFAWSKDGILFGNGSSEIIEKLYFALGNGQKVLRPNPSFSMYKIYAKAAEAEDVVYELNDDYTFDAEKFVTVAKKHKVNMAIICNPNNPTGTGIPLADIEYVAQNFDGALLIDEAYMEFYGASAISLLPKYKNLIIARTFSKAYGLASIRVGYMLASEEIADMIKRSFMPYHLNVLSLITADIAFQMRDEFAPRIAMAIAERERMTEELTVIRDVTVYPSKTNFLLMHHDSAVKLNERLEEKGIGVRSFGNAPRLENCLRISMGLREENDEILNEIKNFVEGN